MPKVTEAPGPKAEATLPPFGVDNVVPLAPKPSFVIVQPIKGGLPPSPPEPG
jgi:hypothetical protein